MGVYYLMKTETNANGNVVFSKQRKGKEFMYLVAQCEEGVPTSPNCPKQVVSKAWILQNASLIKNLGVSGDSIYPVEVKSGSKGKTPKESNGKDTYIVRDYRDVCERLNWDLVYSSEEDILELSTCWGPNDIEYSFYADPHSFVEDVEEQFNGFDPDEYAEELYEFKRQGDKSLPSMRQILNGADELHESLKGLMIALRRRQVQLSN